MTPKEQIKFVRELSKNIAEDIVGQIGEGKIPAEWDGIELRALLAYRHNLSSNMGMRDNRRRKRNFNNYVYINNL